MARRNNINTDIFCALKIAEKSGVPVLFLSNPGAGKSSTVNLFAKVRGYEVVLLRGNSTTAEEVTGYDVAPKDVSYDHKMAAVPLRPSWFEEVIRNHNEGKKTLLFLDEITTANEFVQAALLHLIFERMVKTEKIPDDTLIVSAGNYAQNLSNTMTLLPPVMNRFMLFNIIPTADDLGVFLNKFDGSMRGERRNYFAELEKSMRELDEQEKDIPEKKYNMIGEYIERGLKDVMKILMTQGDKPVDLTVTDLQNIYSDTEKDSKLYGFITFRTLNYLRDATIAVYQCFGKEGISSNLYRNVIDGLCGIGVSRNAKKATNGDDVVITRVGKDFQDYMIKVINDVEKLNNDRLSEYEDYLQKMSKTTKAYTDPELQALFNKVDEILRDKDLENIERPINPETIKPIFTCLTKTGNSLVEKFESKVKVGESDGGEKDIFKEFDITPEAFATKIVTWNRIKDVTMGLKTLIEKPEKSYEADIKKNLNDTMTKLRQVEYKLKMFRKYAVNFSPAVSKIIPEIKV